MGALLACRPPVPTNEAPLLDILEPAPGARLTADSPFALEVRVVDPDGDAPIAVALFAGPPGEPIDTENPLAGEREAATANEVVTFDGLTLPMGLYDLTVVADDGGPDGQRSALVGVEVVAASRAAPADTAD